MQTTRYRNALVGVALTVALSYSIAGQECDAAATGPTPQVAAKAIKSATATLNALNESKDEVVLLARMGQDLTEYGLTYSHLGYAVKKDDGEWVVVHKLNECGTSHADIYEQSLTQFYMDTLFKYQAGLWRINPTVQQRLKPMLLGTGSLAFHAKDYNMVAYPFGTKYQNSNGWVLEVLAHGIDPHLKNRPQAINWLERNGFKASTLKIGAVKRLGARATKANISFDDHPSKSRWAGNIAVVTVDSVVGFMENVHALCTAPSCAEQRIPNN